MVGVADVFGDWDSDAVTRAIGCAGCDVPTRCDTASVMCAGEDIDHDGAISALDWVSSERDIDARQRDSWVPDLARCRLHDGADREEPLLYRS